MNYPIFLKLFDKKCVVVGGGEVAERKVISLLNAGGVVNVISPFLTNHLKELVANKKIEYIPHEFSGELEEDVFLVIGATDDLTINKRLAAEAEKKRILYNIVDQPDDCNYYVPSVVEKGDLRIAISTNGKSPALSKKIRKKIEKEFGNEYAELLKIMGEIREQVKTLRDQPSRKKLFERLINSDILKTLKQNRIDAAREKATLILAQWKKSGV